MKNFYEAIQQERNRQDAKWGEQNHHPYKWMAIIQEELGEAAEIVLEGDTLGGDYLNEWEKELVQVAASAVAALECLERNRGK